MANTVSILSYANTFGEWVVNTNLLAKENNDIAANNYVKPTGTLFLNDPTLGLQVANSAIIQGALQVTGVGSYGYLQNNLRVDGQVYVTNTTLGLVNSGRANIGGLLFAHGPNTGLQVSNTAVIGGNLNVSGATTISNTMVVTGAASLESTLTVLDDVVLDKNVNVTQNTYVNGSAYGRHLFGNTSVESPRIVVTNAIYAPSARQDVDILYANTLTVPAVAYIPTLISNTAVTTQQVSTSTLTSNTITANSVTIATRINAENANASFNNLDIAGQLSLAGNFVVNGQTVYNSNTLTLNAGSGTALSGYLEVNRGSSGSNAAFRWYETQKVWQVKNVDSNIYYDVLDTSDLSSALDSTSLVTAATSNTVNTLNSLIATVNTALVANITSSGIYANGAFAQANAAFAAANNVTPQVQPSFNTANAAFSRANTSANAFVGTTGSVTPTGGSITFRSNNGVVVVATSANTLNVSTSQDLRTSATPTFAGLNLSSPLAISQGGTGASSAVAALTALLPDASSTPAGYVLATAGVGSYYWAAGGTGGGGGATPGTRINTTRLFPTVNTNQTVFTTPAYTPGAGQLRVYIEGVRQYPSDYTETSNTTVTLGSTIPAGSSLMLEVDAYTSYDFYANNITFTAPVGGIPSTANTVQLAIESIESRLGSLGGTDSPTFTGTPRAPTAAVATSNTMIATTAFVKNVLGSGTTYDISISGTAGSAATATTASSVPWSGITSRPTFATVATSGAYSDLSGRPSLAAVATSGIYSDLTGRPTIPTLTSQLTNNSGFITGLDSNTNYRIQGLGVGTAASTYEVRAYGNITAYYGQSDIRLKENIVPLTGALNKIDKIGTYTFNYKTRPDQKNIGVIAQELIEQFPELVYETTPIDEGTGLDTSLAVNYQLLSVVLLQAVKELKAEVEELKGKIK